MAELMRISASHPCLPGHFPGLAIVPGAVLLQCVIDAAAEANPGWAIGGVRRIKFLSRLSPEQAFSIEFDAPGASGLRFRVQSAGSAVADGQLMFRTKD